jgi:NHS family xanthosine MFS transporter
MLAWVLRFGFFAYGDPVGGLWMIIMSCIVYGMAFDFFNISGSLFVETNTDPKNRSSAQGMFMMMTNGIGAILGSFTSGWAIDHFFTKSFTSAATLSSFLQTESNNPLMGEFIKAQGVEIAADGAFSQAILMKDWHIIWLSFALYALVIAIAFAILFKHKHDPKIVEQLNH